MAVFLNAPLVVRVVLYFVVRRYYRLQAATLPSGGIGRTTVLTSLAILLPLIIYKQVPLAIGFTLSRPSMNTIHRWAILHPGDHLPAQWVGVYWAEEITATADGVHFRVWGWPGPYADRSGFMSGTKAPDDVPVEVWLTSDPMWKTWGWSY